MDVETLSRLATKLGRRTDVITVLWQDMDRKRKDGAKKEKKRLKAEAKLHPNPSIVGSARPINGLTDGESSAINGVLPAVHAPCSRSPGGKMLFTIAVILLVLWLLGLVSGYTLGNFIYVLLVIALVLFVVGLVSGRRTV